LPGTHAKWVKAEQETVKEFTTWMTGDFFNCLSGHTIFKEQITSNSFNKDAFQKGLSTAKDSGPMLNSAFYLRTDYLFGKVNSEDFHSYLSGFLIGSEVKEASKGCSEVYLCGSERMIPYYKEALQYFGIQAIEVPAAEASVLGMQAITQAAVHG
ncbi:MAG: 2-dehydro-3-deoxygalactonokinase, partial [Lentisphaeraceae bacterium]|nr:2-dehydro-3-deoxygalactonokinase [Lentisphaeraceae bacterium]